MVAHRRSKFRNEIEEDIVVEKNISLSLNSKSVSQTNSTDFNPNVFSTLVSVLTTMDKIKDDVMALFS